MNCKNCGSLLSGAFCATCGQRADTKRLTLPYLVAELLHFFTHIEKGFLYTLWRMIVTAGRTTNDYIIGKRVRLQPVSFFLAHTSLQ